MNKPGRSVSLAFYGIGIALLSLTAFFTFTVYFLLVFVPVVAYAIWNMYNRISALEKRLTELKRPQNKP